MKILHIVDSMGFGGAQIVVKGIFESQKENSDIFLFSLRKREINIDIKHKNIYIYTSKSKYSFRPIKKLKEIIKKEQIDVLHCHLPRSQVFGWILKKYYFPDIKLIFHEHGRILGSEGRGIKIFLEQQIFYQFTIFSRNYVDLYIAVSRAIEHRLIEKTKVPQNKIQVLYNFVDLEKFNRESIAWDIQKEREKIGIKEGCFVVGFAGRLVERKGWREFLGAAKLILSTNQNFKFVIAGDGPQKIKMLKLMESLNVGNNVLYLGYISNMVWFYPLLNCFVIPSHWEPMGLTEIEAQAMGIPVIASDKEGLNEIIIDGENGLLFKVKDVNDLAKKINMLKNDIELRLQLIRNGINNIKKYSLASYIQALKNLYLL